MTNHLTFATTDQGNRLLLNGEDITATTPGVELSWTPGEPAHVVLRRDVNTVADMDVLVEREATIRSDASWAAGVLASLDPAEIEAAALDSLGMDEDDHALTAAVIRACSHALLESAGL